MRLFVAVNFDKDTVEHLYKGAETLRENSLSANISRRENLHLTLAFIGEVTSAKNAINALSSIDVKPFTLTLQGYGEFGKGSICFAKTKPCPELLTLAEKVRKKLTAKGIRIDTKPFKPHITLARQLEPTLQFDKGIMNKVLSTREVQIKEISLMRSDRIKGRLTYTELYKKTLE